MPSQNTNATQSTNQTNSVADILLYNEWIAENLFVISEEGGDILPLHYNPIQQELNRTYDEIKARGDLARIIVLKARRHGVSTWWQSRIFERIARQSNIRGLVLAHEDEASGELFDISRMFLECAAGIVPPRLNDSGSRIRFAPPHWSQLRVQTAFRHKGSGATIHMLHVSELAKWSDPRTTMLSLRQAAREADVVIESTANGKTGQGQYFYNQWQLARRGESGYVAKFFAWFDNPLYRIPEDSPAFSYWMNKSRLSSEEKALQSAHQLSDGQLAWRRKTIADECGGEVDDFRQEFPSNDEEAFLRVEGDRVFDLGACNAYLSKAKVFNEKNPPIKGFLNWKVLPELNHTGRCINRDKLRVVFREDPDGPVTLYALPDPKNQLSHRYKGAGDVAKGVKGGDSNSAAILDRHRKMIVATWHELCDATLFGEYCARLAIFYGAEVAIEANGVGHAALVKLLEIVGPKYTWASHKFRPGDPVSEFDNGRWGWDTTDRWHMANGLKDVIRNDSWFDPDEKAWAEIMAIVKEASGRPAFNGKDRTMSRAILWRMNELSPPMRNPEGPDPEDRDYSGRKAKKKQVEEKYNPVTQGGLTKIPQGRDWRDTLGLRKK